LVIILNLVIQMTPAPFIVETDTMNISTRKGILNNSQPRTLSLPIKRSANFTYSNITITDFPVQDISPQKSAPTNSTLLSDMVSLTIEQRSAWRNFSLPLEENFLAIDGASQSMVLVTLIEVYSPDGTLVKAANTTSSQPFHYVNTSPRAGLWSIRLTLNTAGNTTVWIQAISFNNGVKFVEDYHKESVHIYAGQAIYFKVSISSKDWVDFFAQKMAGGYIIFELFLPTDYSAPWLSSWDSFENFLFPPNLPELGVYLFVVRNYEYGGGDADIVVQITKKNGVTKILHPNDKISLKFNMTNENEYFWIAINQPFQWLAVDGGVTSDGSVRFILRKPDGTVEADMISYSYEYPVSHMIAEPQIGNYLLVVRGYQKGVITTVQVCTNGWEVTLSEKTDVNITFRQSGQTIYYIINTTNTAYFIFSGLSLGGHIIYKIFNFRYELIWVAESWRSSFPQSILQVPVGNQYLLSIQGQKLSSTIIHLRFDGDEDFQISPPDYSDFEMRFFGDFLLLKLSIPNVAYFMQFWHNLAPAYVMARIYDANYFELSRIDLWGQDSEARLVWRRNIESFTPGDWIIFLTGEKGQPIRVSQLKAGDEERAVNTPFHIFETFDFNYQATTFTVNVSSSMWLSIVAQTQTDVRFFMRVYDPNLQQVWEIYTDYRYQPYHGFWKNPTPGIWLIIVDGLSNTNASLTFRCSQDPMSTLLTGVSKSDIFGYYGDTRYYKVTINNGSFIGFGGMSLSDHTHLIYLINPTGDIFYSTQVYGKLNTFHYFVVNNFTGVWFVILIGQPISKLIIRLSINPDAFFDIPYACSYIGDYDGEILYESFEIKNDNAPLQLNITNNVDANSWVFLYEPDGGPFYWYGNGYVFHLYYRTQFETITIHQPMPGRWTVAIIQEKFANITLSIGYTEALPPPPPYGIFIEFIEPQDVQAYLVNGSIVMSSKVSGAINVIVNVTDFYHSIVEVILYYNGGKSMTHMTFNYTSLYYQSEFNTTQFDDGLHELIVYARCEAGEIGIASISILIDNHTGYPVISEFPSFAIIAIVLFGLFLAVLLVRCARANYTKLCLEKIIISTVRASNHIISNLHLKAES
jgi:hypothetical protein